MTFERVAWSLTVLVALITALLLLLSGYNGYAGLGLRSLWPVAQSRPAIESCV